MRIHSSIRSIMTLHCHSPLPRFTAIIPQLRLLPRLRLIPHSGLIPRPRSCDTPLPRHRTLMANALPLRSTATHSSCSIQVNSLRPRLLATSYHHALPPRLVSLRFIGYPLLRTFHGHAYCDTPLPRLLRDNHGCIVDGLQ
jgi:hypothetical protein